MTRGSYIYISEREAASLLRVAPKTLARWRSKEVLPHWTWVFMNRRVIYIRQNLERWVLSETYSNAQGKRLWGQLRKEGLDRSSRTAIRLGRVKKAKKE
jgi:hypothetical protein